MVASQHAVDHEAAEQGPGHAHGGADQLGGEAHAAQAAQGLLAEDAGGDAAPGAAQAVQRPDAQHVVDLPVVLREREHPDEQAAGDGAHHQCTKRVHHIGAGAHGHQAGQRAVVHKAGVVLAGEQGGERAAHHGHQRVHGDQARDLVQASGRSSR